jgi:palmitoyl-protein thioesterase
LKDHRYRNEYAEHAKFLPFINNEKDHPKKELNKKRFTQLNLLTMIKFKYDPIVYPRESSWFGEDAPDGKHLLMEDTDIFKKDTFGLKTLNDQGRIDKKEIEGVHLQMTNNHIKEIIVPALTK